MKQVLVIGGGSIGERHVRCFQKTRRPEVSLCEVNDDVRTRVADIYGLGRTFGSFGEALKKRFDAAVVCTPAHLHIEMARQLVERGIAALIEKPLSVSPAGVRQLLEAVGPAAVRRTGIDRPGFEPRHTCVFRQNRRYGPFRPGRSLFLKNGRARLLPSRESFLKNGRARRLPSRESFLKNGRARLLPSRESF